MDEKTSMVRGVLLKALERSGMRFRNVKGVLNPNPGYSTEQLLSFLRGRFHLTKSLEPLAGLFYSFQHATYTCEQSIAVLMEFFKKIHKIYGETYIPFTYTTEPLPTPANYTDGHAKELKYIESFLDRNHFGRLDVIYALNYFIKNGLISIWDLSILEINIEEGIVLIKFHLRLKKDLIRTFDLTTDTSERPTTTKDTQCRLVFNKDTGETAFKSAYAPLKVGTKTYAIVSVMAENKNMPFAVKDVAKYCNPRVTLPKYHFKGYHDIEDTIRQIKRRLKVKKGVVFPIRIERRNNENVWIWHE